MFPATSPSSGQVFIPTSSMILKSECFLINFQTGKTCKFLIFTWGTERLSLPFGLATVYFSEPTCSRDRKMLACFQTWTCFPDLLLNISYVYRVNYLKITIPHPPLTPPQHTQSHCFRWLCNTEYPWPESIWVSCPFDYIFFPGVPSSLSTVIRSS